MDKQESLTACPHSQYQLRSDGDKSYAFLFLSAAGSNFRATYVMSGWINLFHIEPQERGFVVMYCRQEIHTLKTEHCSTEETELSETSSLLSQSKKKKSLPDREEYTCALV
jgi:hypothetical protein